MRAERLAYYNCCMDRTTYDKLIASDGKADPLVIGDRLMDTTIQISSRDFEDLRTIQICDWLEQVGRSKDWAYRRESERIIAISPKNSVDLYRRTALPRGFCLR